MALAAPIASGRFEMRCSTLVLALLLGLPIWIGVYLLLGWQGIAIGILSFIAMLVYTSGQLGDDDNETVS